MDRRQSPGWQFSTLCLVKDSLAVMLESAHMYEDALREYSELEACYLEALDAGGPLSQQPFGVPAHMAPLLIQQKIWLFLSHADPLRQSWLSCGCSS